MNSILDWFGREGGALVAWWVLSSLMALAVLPLCARLLGGLADKGYTLARTVGLLLVSFVFWFLASLGGLTNSVGSMVLALVLVAGIAWLLLKRDFKWADYWRGQKRLIIASEILFAVLLIGWTIVRIHHPDTSTTEKPMELAFISGIMRSEVFPPNDPWMAGYSISYYYFGYVMVAMLSSLSGVTSTVGFSLTVALWFALSGLTAFGVVYNMVMARGALFRAALGAGLLASFFLVFMSNAQFPLVELPYQMGVGEQSYYQYWRVPERENAPTSLNNAPLDPSTWSYWWWFRGSRVLSDRWIDGQEMPRWWAQPISEFPNFSFVLADNHPHVLALPFAVMALGMALNIAVLERAPRREEVLLYGVVVGGLIFLNTWDGPIYLTLFVGAQALWRVRARGALAMDDLWQLVTFGLSLLAIALVAYFPFFVGFRSQAAGVLPNPVTPTYFPQFFLMFAPFLLMGGAFLWAEAWRAREQMAWRRGILSTLALLGVLVLVMGALMFVGALVPAARNYVAETVQNSGGWGAVLPQFIQRRLEYAPSLLVLLLALAAIVARLFAPVRQFSHVAEGSATRYSASTAFALLLMGAGAGLILIPEFIYLRDNFGTRINTVFKFYYQAWVALSLACAYGAYVLLSAPQERLSAPLRAFVGGMLALVIGAGSLYGIFAIHTRAIREFNPPDKRLTLDGGRYMTLNPEDYEAVRCLDALVQGDEAVVAEAVRDAYAPQYARVGSITGIPIVIGWENHERQWRGATYQEVAGSRAVDIERLFSHQDWWVALEIIQRYGIDYVFFGQTERNQYGSQGEAKFEENGRLVCNYGNTRVYAVSASPQTASVP